MASIIKRPGGHRWIQFVDPQGKRKTLRIGMTTAKSAAEICRRVELLLAARVANTSLDRESAGWLAGVDGKLRDRLVSVGLIEQATASVCDQQTNGMALGEWLASYVAKRTDTSPHTRRIWRQTVAKLNEFFGEDRSLESITRGEAKDWRLSLVASGLADASVRKHCGFAKHFSARPSITRSSRRTRLESWSRRPWGTRSGSTLSAARRRSG